MKKGFERPSQKEVVVASENGVNVVADIPTNEAAKEVGGVASKYVKYNEVVDASKINCFKPTIVNKPDKNFLNLTVPMTRSYQFDFKSVRMLGMRWRVRNIKDLILSALEAAVLNEINEKRELQSAQKNNDAEYRMKAGIIRDVMFAHSKEKEFIAVLDKFTVVQDDCGTDLLSTMNTDPHFKINSDVVPDFVKALAVEPFEIKHYGEELVVVLDINKVMANVAVRSVVAGDYEEACNYIKLGNTVYANGYINTVITVDGATQTENLRFDMTDAIFVYGRFQFTHEMLRDTLIGKTVYEIVRNEKGEEEKRVIKEAKPLSAMEATESSDLVFVRTADIAGQTLGAEALKMQMAGLPSGVNYTSIPLIKVSKAKYTVKNSSTGNPLLDSLMSNASRVEVIDNKAILNDYNVLLDGRVYSFNVGFGGGRDLCILPNFRNLIAFTLFGREVLSSNSRLPKIDITDNGQTIAVAASL